MCSMRSIQDSAAYCFAFKNKVNYSPFINDGIFVNDKFQVLDTGEGKLWVWGASIILRKKR